MAEIHRLPDPQQVEQAAGDWLARMQSERATDMDRTRFRDWLDAHPSHRRAYDELLQTWQRFERAGPLVRTVTTGQMLGSVQRQAQPRAWLPKAAAALVLMAVLGWAGWSAFEPPGNSLQTAVGQQASVSLPDGSKVNLNTNSAMDVDYRTDARIVRLGRGEAHFEVAHDVHRPFWVIAGGTWIRAVGTAFDVYLGPQTVKVMVTDGSVQVAAARRAPARQPSDTALAHTSHSLLAAGQQMEYDGAAAQIRAATPHELRRSQAWRSGVLEFENQTLAEVLNELSRYTSLQLIIEDEELKNVRVGGTFKAREEGVEALLAMLEQAWGVELRRESLGRVYLSKKRS